MKLAGPILVNVALLAVGAVAAVWLVNKASGALTTAAGALNPASRDNLAYQGVNAIGDALVPPLGPGRYADGSWSLGAWAYDITHDDPMGGGATGSW